MDLAELVKAIETLKAFSISLPNPNSIGGGVARVNTTSDSNRQSDSVQHVDENFHENIDDTQNVRSTETRNINDVEPPDKGITRNSANSYGNSPTADHDAAKSLA